MLSGKESKLPTLDEFKNSFNQSINTLIRLSAPRNELVPPTSQATPDLDEKDDEPELKNDEDAITQAAETKLGESINASETIIEVMEEKSKEPEQKHSILLENEKAAAEEKDYQDFVQTLNELRKNVFTGYQQAVGNNDTETMGYLNRFSKQMAVTVHIIKNRHLRRQQKQEAIDQLIFAASPSPDVLKKAEPIVSWVFYLLGGFIGLIIGASVGAFCGGVTGVVCALYMALQGGVNDANGFIACALVLGTVSAIAGTIFGVAAGVTEGSSFLYSLSHSTLFRPSEIGNHVEKGLKSKVIHRWIGKQKIEREIRTFLSSEKLPEPLLSIATDYLNADDKEFKGIRPA